MIILEVIDAGNTVAQLYSLLGMKINPLQLSAHPLRKDSPTFAGKYDLHKSIWDHFENSSRFC
jgi:hypothetical protein